MLIGVYSMAATTLIRITNTSAQLIPIMVNSIDAKKANTKSSVLSTSEGVYQMVAGSEITIELQRVSVSQLNQLQNLGQIKYS